MNCNILQCLVSLVVSCATSTAYFPQDSSLRTMTSVTSVTRTVASARSARPGRRGSGICPGGTLRSAYILLRFVVGLPEQTIVNRIRRFFGSGLSSSSLPLGSLGSLGSWWNCTDSLTPQVVVSYADVLGELMEAKSRPQTDSDRLRPVERFWIILDEVG